MFSEVYPVSKTAHAVFVAGIRYPSLFDADLDSGIRSVSIWKALKKNNGNPVLIRNALVVLESWVSSRIEIITRDYAL
jgi:hypothetical protein